MFLYAFDLIELNGDDLRRDLEVRKATLISVVVVPVGLCRVEESTKSQFHSTILTHQGLRPNKMGDATDNPWILGGG